MKSHPCIFFAALLLASPPLPTHAAPGDAPAENVANANYVLAPNDLISVKVFQEDDLTTSCRVAADGTVSLPLIGQIKVSGQSAQDASRQIARLLDARFLVNPQVSVSITSMAKRRFTILGAVAKAGAYNMQFVDSIDLLEAIGLAGGYTRMANPAKITIKRHENGRDTVVEINGKELASGSGGKAFRVMPGDTVTVAERMF